LEYIFEFLSIILIICVLVLIRYANFFKTNAKTLESEIDSLKSQSTQDSSSYRSREEKLNQDLSSLRSEFSRTQEIVIKRENDLENKEKTYLEKIKTLESSIEEVDEARKKILSQKKSSEVRIGHIAEKLAPFLDDFEFDPEKCIFLGQPIDYISFGEDEITFIEVKSGKSQLNQKQRQIRDLVKAKHVSWKEFRII
jgi:predicted Holliday junction resolvase-like endonuclease